MCVANGQGIAGINILHLDFRRGGTGLQLFVHHQCTGWRNALVQYADLTRQREHDYREAYDKDPQNQVGNEQDVIHGVRSSAADYYWRSVD